MSDELPKSNPRIYYGVDVCIFKTNTTSVGLCGFFLQ